MKQKFDAVSKYEESCNEVLADFVNKYYLDVGEIPVQEFIDDDCDWIGGIGEIVNIGDYYHNMYTMVTALKNNVSKDDFFQWYSDNLDAALNHKLFPNLQNWLKGAKGEV